MPQRIRSAEGVLRVIPPPGHPAILPKSGEPNVLITSALPYCNNVPHLGNIIGSTLSADVFSRCVTRMRQIHENLLVVSLLSYSRTRNRTTLYICGTDEYGTATETQALKENITPRELCDKYHLVHKATYEWFDIGFDHFGRTSAPLHTDISQEIFSNLGKHKLLEKQSKEQTYCEGCPKFLADRFVEGICPHCGYEDARGDQCDNCTRTLDAIELIKPRCLVDKTHVVTTRTSAHMYFKMNEVQPRTVEWIKRSWKAGKWSSNSVINGDGEIIDARLTSGLHPTPLTRDLKWGVPVPIEGNDELGMQGKVLYVWFDAPIGYPSITANYTPEWKKWWFNPQDVRLYQFMGKDNVYFHTVYWPSVQLGMVATGPCFIIYHRLVIWRGKFSKSRGRGVFGPAAKETGIPASVWRYYLLSSRPENADSTFSWPNAFGNFVNRTLKFVVSQYNSVIPDSDDAPGPLSVDDSVDAKFVEDVNELLKTYIDAMDAVKLRLGLQTVMLISSHGNTYLQASGLNKALMAENPTRCAQVLSRAVNLIYVLSALIYPFMPATSEAILAQLNAPARAVPDVLSNDILVGHTIGKPDHLFKKIEESMAETFRSKFGGMDPPAEPTADPSQAPPLSKRQAAAAKKAALAAKADSGPKSPEYLALEVKIQEQGSRVRSLKGQVPKTSALDAEIAAAVDVLKGLKLKQAALPGS
ncbi:methionyl-tRNA synthetase [Mycena sp. CBHHK59/15]|nr:methionyl-tRNA synthetase [Mycena sp. CBHHK59/15]